MRSLVFSALVHMALFALLWGAIQRSTTTPTRIRTIEVQVTRQSRRSEGGSPGARAQAPSGAHRSGVGAVRLRDLAPRLPGQGVGGLPGPGRLPRDPYAAAETMGLAEETSLLPFTNELWRRINAVVRYPDDFVKQRIRGVVTVQMVVDRKGVFSGEFLDIEANDDFLRVYVVAILLHALKQPQRPGTWAPAAMDEKLSIVAHFDFRLFSDGDEARQPPTHARFKNQLIFNRDAYVQPWINERLTEFYERYWPPIVVVPGGFYIDFIRAYQMLSNIGKPTAREAREDRLKVQKETWETLIQRTAEGS